MEISKLLNSIGLSVQQAQEFLSLQDIERYMRYFKKGNSEDALSNEDSPLCPKAIRFSLGSKEDSYIDVPVAVMAQHETMGLTQVKVTINGEIYEDTQTHNILIHTGASPAEDTNNGTVELVFESRPQSEGQARATQKMLDKMEI